MRLHTRAYVVLTTVCLLGARVLAADEASQPLSFDKDVTPLIQKYCYQCHGNGKAKADLALDSFKTEQSVVEGRKSWEQVLNNIRTREMPPEEAKAQPTQAERDQITGWIEKKLFNYDPKNPDPGRVTIRRLNRAEYNNTIRDLVGVEFQPADDFPSDDSGYGFDNIGDVLSLPPVLMEKYLAAATRIMDEAIVTEPLKSKVRHYSANLMEMGFNADGDRGDGWMPLSALEEDGVATAIPVPAGDYVVRVQAFVRGRGAGAGGGAGRGGRGGRGPASQPAAEDGAATDGTAADAPAPVARRGGGAPQPLKLSLMLDNAVVNDWDVAAPEDKPGVYEYRVGVPYGKHRFKVLNRRIRGGENELLMKNGRLGREQGGVVWVKWVEIEGPLHGATRRYPAAKLEAKGDGRNLANGGRLLDHNGEVSVSFNVPKAGEYLLRAQASADQAGDEPARMEWKLNGESLKTFDVLAPGKLQPLDTQRVFSMELLNAMPYVYEMRVNLPAGETHFSAVFINDHVDPEAKNPNLRDRNLYIDYLEVVNLDEAQPLPPIPDTLKRNFTREPTNQTQRETGREIVGNFVHRAWRRPVTDQELTGLMTLFDTAAKNGDSFEASLKLPMKAALVSPFFLFRGEIQPEPDNPKSVHQINEFSLASRLSYFLWSSMPDDELLDLAEHGELRKNLQPQVQRMLKSPKAQALVQNFAGQWLQIRNLQFVAPDTDIYYFDESLRGAMRKETELFFESIMREDRSIFDFLTADYTFMNERLAQHYGMNDVKGEEFRRVSLKGTPRMGLLTQASVLTITSNPTRTSPVKRGKWVLDNLLGTPPPPPPPDVPELKNDGKPETGSLRKQMEQHRVNPSCASCHARMDPIGFGLEGFDGVGQIRTKDGEFPIDTAGQLVSGETFNGPVDLANILATKKRDEFARCLSEKMLTYALGRGLEYYDRGATDKIVEALQKNDYTFSALVMEVVNSLPFQMRRGDGVVAQAN